MTVPMALMDFVPVLLFGAAWVILYRDLKNKLNLCSGVLLPLGAVIVFLAGFFKALWKLQNAVQHRTQGILLLQEHLHYKQKHLLRL